MQGIGEDQCAEALLFRVRDVFDLLQGKINFAKIYLAVIYIITCKRFTQGKLGAFRMFRFSFRWDHGGNNFYHRSGQWCVRKGRA